MRQVFISYARDDRDRVEALAERLRRLVDGVWFDSQLHGGEDWWAGILERIRSCDVFLSVVSQSSLDSEACRIEREYARQIDRTIIPVALEHVPQALPTDLATLQIVDFTTPGEGALADLARALLGAHDAAPVPDPLPEDPEPPLSYLTSLVDLVASPRELTKSEQMDILSRLEHGLQASDPDEQEGARQVLSHMAVRDDLASSVEKTIRLLGGEHPREPSSLHQAEQPARPAATQAAPLRDTAQRKVTVEPEPARPADVTSASAAASGSSRDSELDDRRHGRLVIVAVLVVLIGILGVIWADSGGGGGGGGGGGDDCAGAPSAFPGEVTHGTDSGEALAWQKLLVREGVFGRNNANCTGAYTGPKQKGVVEEKRRSLELAPSNGLLDWEFYECLVNDNCGNAPPPAPE